MLDAYHVLNYIDEEYENTKGDLDSSQMKLICAKLSLPDTYNDKKFLVKLLELRDRCDLKEKESSDIDEDDVEDIQEVESWDDYENCSEEELKEKVLEVLGMDINAALRENDLLVACLRVHDESMGEFGNRYSSNVQELENLC